MLRLPDRWVWDSWHADDGERHHLFFLQAPRSLGDPTQRHWHATVGHAVSTDLRSWKVIGDALLPGPPGAWDDLSIWTGSVLQHGRRWFLFYTACSTRDNGLVQRIGGAVSEDLHTWERLSEEPLLVADARWYERLDPERWHDEAWRDPWVFADADGNGFHALVTARVPDAPPWAAGVIGHAWSPDLLRWEARPPVCEASGFGQLEVPQVVATDQGHVLLFSFDPAELPPRGEAEDGPQRLGSTYLVPAAGPLGPFELDRAVPIGPPDTYAGRLTRDRTGAWQLLAFRNRGPHGFVGEVIDPVPLATVWPAEWGAPAR